MRFHKLILLTVIFLSLISCTKKKPNSFKSSTKDSILHYYDQSNNKQLSYPDRLNKINKSYRLLNLNKIDSLQLAIIDRKTKIHFSLEQYDSVKHFNTLLYKKSTEINNIFYKARYHYVNSYYHEFILQKKDSAFSNTIKSIEYYKLLNDSSNTGKRYLDLAYMKNDIDDYFGSIESSINAINYFSNQKTEDLVYIASSYNVIAFNHEDLLMHDKAIENYKKAISLAPSINDQLSYKNNLATFYNKIGNYKKSIQILKSINLDSVKPILIKALYEDNLAYSKWLNDPKENILQTLQKNLKLKKSKNDIVGLVDSYEYLAKYFMKKDITKAISYANMLIESSKILGHPKGVLKGLKIIMKVDDTNLHSKNQYINLKDSITLSHLNTRNQYAKIKYDNTKTLQANKTLIQKNEEEKLLKSIYALFALIAVVIFTFYLYYSQQKRKETHLKYEQDKLQSVYKTETDISKKIHDEIANGIYQVMIHAQNENNPLSEKSIDKLDQIYKRTRNFSHQISEISVNENYLTELQGMLEDYQSQDTNIVVSGIKSMSWNNISEIKKETVYRVLNELMVNMTKHSQAHLVVLKFTQSKKYIKISYSDNGIGITNNQFVVGTGLKNVENRIHSIQGTFNFENNHNKGVQINIAFPS